MAGMSFECAVDRFLFKTLHRVQNEMPVGESHWIIVNPCTNTLQHTRSILILTLPVVTVQICEMKLSCWLDQQLPELIHFGTVTD